MEALHHHADAQADWHYREFRCPTATNSHILTLSTALDQSGHPGRPDPESSPTTVRPGVWGAQLLMRESVGDRLGVKASGGIRDTATALAMLAAGASRLGLSGTRAVLAGLPA